MSFDFCFSVSVLLLKEKRKQRCVKFGSSYVIKSELFRGGNYHYGVCLTPWTTLNGAARNQVLHECFRDELMLHAKLYSKHHQFLQTKIIVILLVAKRCSLLSVKSKCPLVLMLSYTFHYKKDT